MKHGGCWYCGYKKQEILRSVQKKIIAVDGSASTLAVAVCNKCEGYDTLDCRIPVEARTLPV